MANKFLSIVATTINGEIQEFPPTISIPCDLGQAEGEAVIRDFDINTCIVAVKVFLIRYGKNLFGTKQFTNVDEFRQYQAAVCQCCGNCGLTVDGCGLYFNNCNITYSKN